MALADFQSTWTNKIKPWIVAGFIAVTPVASGATAQLVLQDGSLVAQSTFIPATEKGANNGVATLDATGKVPSSQLPAYVDDVLEFANQAAFPEEGEGGKIYVALDNNKTYRWGGTTYVEISAGLALGETQGTAYEGSKGAANAAAIANLQADKAEKSEMSITDGTGSDADKTTIQLNSGLSKQVLIAHQDISGKADKDTDAVANNFAKFDANGNPVDSGKNASDFATSEQGNKADSAIQSVKVNGTALTPDSNKAVDVTVPVRVTAAELDTFVV